MIAWRRRLSLPTAEQLRHLEDCIKGTLPQDYKDYLLLHNGGTPSGDVVFRIPGITGDFAEVLLGAMYGIKGSPGGIDIETQYRGVAHSIPSGFVPIGEDPGGNLLLLSLTPPSVGQVHFCDRIGFLAESVGRSMFLISDSIGEFLDSLQPSRDQ